MVATLANMFWSCPELFWKLAFAFYLAFYFLYIHIELPPITTIFRVTPADIPSILIVAPVY